MDGVHPTHNVQPAYGWIKKGIRKEIAAKGVLQICQGQYLKVRELLIRIVAMLTKMS